MSALREWGRANEVDYWHRYHDPETCFYVTNRIERVIGDLVKCDCPVMSPENSVERLRWFFGREPTAFEVAHYNETIFGSAFHE